MSTAWTLVGVLTALLVFVFVVAISAPRRPGAAPPEIERDNAGKPVKARPIVRFIASFAFSAAIMSVGIFLHSGGRLSTGGRVFAGFVVVLIGLLSGFAAVRGGRLQRFIDGFFSGGL
jgi:hypothetical protein